MAAAALGGAGWRLGLGCRCCWCGCGGGGLNAAFAAAALFFSLSLSCCVLAFWLSVGGERGLLVGVAQQDQSSELVVRELEDGPEGCSGDPVGERQVVAQLHPSVV